MSIDWRVELFGSLRARSSERVVTHFRTHRNALLIARLALSPQQRLTRDHLGDCLWPERSTLEQRKDLRWELSKLRETLSPGLIVTQGHTFVWLSESTTSDVADFDVAYRTALQAGLSAEKRVPYLEAAARLNTQDLVPELEAVIVGDWLERERRRLREDALSVLSRLVLDFLELGRRAEAEHWYQVALRRFPDYPIPFQQDESRLKVAETPLPYALSSLLGRERERQEIQDWLTNKERRLLTLTGPGGIGKTSLLEELPRTESTWWLSLAGTTEASLFFEQLRVTLRLSSQGQDSLRERVVRFLQHQESPLLLLDNLEHLARPLAPLLKSLLAECPHLRCITTSRRALQLEGEELLTLSALSLSDAKTLFLARARAIRPDFARTDKGTKQVEDICMLLEGLPLAIELVAARALVLGPFQIREQLRLEFVKSIRPTKYERHRSLRAALEWSYQLLAPDVQKIFRELSIFRGGFTLEAAQTLCGTPSLIDALEELRLHSLLTVAFDRDDDEEQARYNLLVSLQEFGREKLSLEEHSSLAKQHASYFSQKIITIGKNFTQADWIRLRNDVPPELENLRSAMHFIRTQGTTQEQFEWMVQLGPSLFEFGYLADFAALIEPLIGVPLPDEELSRVLGFQGILELRRGNEAVAQRHWEQRLALAQRLGNAHRITDTLRDLAIQALDKREYTRASQLIAEARTVQIKFNLTGMVVPLTVLEAQLALHSNQPEHALQKADAVQEFLVQEQDQVRHIVMALYLAPVYQALGEFVKAQRLLEKTLPLALERRLPYHLANLLRNTSQLASQRGKILEGGQALYLARELHRELDSRHRHTCEHEWQTYLQLHGDHPELHDWLIQAPITLPSSLLDFTHLDRLIPRLLVATLYS